MMKMQKGVKTDDLRVWCAGCSIRIAPHEEQIAVDSQKYHPLCYVKHSRAISKDAPKPKAPRR
jgi:hypothetical protein